MKKIVLPFTLLVGTFMTAPIFAQETAPELDALGAGDPAVQSELDILSQQTEDAAFPDLNQASDRRPVSVTLRALNKTTAKYTDLTIAMDQPWNFGSLEITPRYCDKRPPEEFPETTAFLEIRDLRPAPKSDFKETAPRELVLREQAEAREEAADEPVRASDLPDDMVFSGWMFASSPALSALEHPVYDVWVIDCATEAVEN
ncbi:MAG: DUF2155 domain-containing protein [Parvularculaceae bacterium]